MFMLFTTKLNGYDFDILGQHGRSWEDELAEPGSEPGVGPSEPGVGPSVPSVPGGYTPRLALSLQRSHHLLAVHTHRHTDRQTCQQYTQTHRTTDLLAVHTYRHTDRQTCQHYTHTDRTTDQLAVHTHRHTDRRTCQKYTHTDTQTDRLVNGTHTQTHRHTDTKTGRKAQIKTHRHQMPHLYKQTDRHI